MYLIYVDESGDIGTNNSPTRYYVLSGLVIHERRWKLLLENCVAFRRVIRDTKHLKLRDEIHSSHFISRGAGYTRVKRNDRADILKKCIEWCGRQANISIINIVVNKNGKTQEQIFERAWMTLIQRFDNTIHYGNFPDCVNGRDEGLVLADNTDGKKVMRLLRKMRKYNPVANIQNVFGGGFRDIPIRFIIEDPVLRNSADSLLHQVVDVVAYSVRQLYEPNQYFRKKGGHKIFYKLDPILCKHASRMHRYGIVEL